MIYAPRKPRRQLAIDDLPGKRCVEALALLHYLKHCGGGWVTLAFGYVGKVAADLERCGHVELLDEGTIDGRRLIRVELKSEADR